jgi:hypothetical protein
VRVRMRVHVCEGVGREGKREVWRVEGMGEADGGIWCEIDCKFVFVLGDRACVCVRVFGCAHICVIAFDQVYLCVYLRARVRTSRFEARHDACSVQTTIGYFQST